MIVLYSILWILFCIVMQVLVFNQLHLFGGIVFIFLVGLIKMPLQMNRTIQIIIGFLCGLIVDIFTNTLGMHALACSTIMWLRMPLLRIFMMADEMKIGTIGLNKLGVSAFVRYILIIITLYSLLFYFVESLTLFAWLPMLLKSSMTIVMTFLFTMAVELADYGK